MKEIVKKVLEGTVSLPGKNSELTEDAGLDTGLNPPSKLQEQ
jgi:hypothetical protein